MTDGPKDVTGKPTQKVDYKATYAEVAREVRALLKAKANLDGDTWSARFHWATCCYHELIAADQENASIKDRASQRLAKMADDSAPRVAQSPLTFAPSAGPPTPATIKREMDVFFASSTTPFHLVDTPEFRKLITTLSGAPDSSIPVHTTASRGVLSAHSLLLKEIELQAFDAIRPPSPFDRDTDITLLDDTVMSVRGEETRALFSITLDGWTSRSMKPFLGVTLHYITRGRMRRTTTSQGSSTSTHLRLWCPVRRWRTLCRCACRA
jgi:hypothetical protein